MAGAFLAVGFLIGYRRQDWIDLRPDGDRPSPAALVPRSSRRRALVLLIGLFVLGAGIEGTAGDWSYTQLTAGRLLSTGLAGLGASLFWAGLAGGGAPRASPGEPSDPDPRRLAIAAARARSSGVVILMLSTSPSMTDTSPPAHSTTEAVSVPMNPWRAALLCASSSQVA